MRMSKTNQRHYIPYVAVSIVIVASMLLLIEWGGVFRDDDRFLPLLIIRELHKDAIERGSRDITFSDVERVFEKWEDRSVELQWVQWNGPIAAEILIFLDGPYDFLLIYWENGRAKGIGVSEEGRVRMEGEELKGVLESNYYGRAFIKKNSRRE